jgi:hypothetical protein
MERRRVQHAVVLETIVMGVPDELGSLPSAPMHPHHTRPQDVFNLLPNLNAAELSKSFVVESNDMMLVVYLASLIRSVIALHNLIDNKEAHFHHEKAKVHTRA